MSNHQSSQNRTTGLYRVRAMYVDDWGRRTQSVIPFCEIGEFEPMSVSGSTVVLMDGTVSTLDSLYEYLWRILTQYSSRRRLDSIEILKISA